MKNRKGFTLVELLVVIVILGIITGLSIPLIRNVSASMEKKKYTTYNETVLSGAKLYNDSYSEDLFGHNENGCAYVTYAQLKERNLLKDIEISDVSCDSDSTFVRILKIGDKYAYSPFLGCGKKKNGKAGSIDTTLPVANQENVMKPEYCTGTEENNLEIVSDPIKSDVYDKKKKKAKIKITSGTGINPKIVLSYKWSTSNTNVSGDFTSVSFKVPGNQKEKLLNGEVISTQSADITTPDNSTGNYYLIIKVDQLQDLYGSKWKNKNPISGVDSKYMALGPFAIDNHKPDADFVIASTITDYNSLNTTVKITANDQEVGKNVTYCISKSNDNCNPTTKYVENKEIPLKMNGAYDGLERTVYIAVKDVAGNVTRISKKYKVAKQYVVLLDSNGSTKPGSTSTTVMQNDTHLGTITNPEKVVTITYVNNAGATVSGGDKTKTYTLNGWYTAASGGSKVANTSTTPALEANVSGFTNANKQWTRTEDSTTLYAHWNNVTATLPKITKTGHTCKWTTDNGGSSVNSGGTWTFSSANSRTFTAACSPNTYSIKYDANEGTGAPSKQEYQYAASGSITLSTTKPTKTGYTFEGWYLNKSGTGTKYTPGQAWNKNNANNYTLYAKWSIEKPTCTITVSSGTKGKNDWYTSDVSIKMTTTGSSISSKGLATSKKSTNGLTTATISSETTTGTTYYGYVANSSVSNECSITIKIDKTEPKCNRVMKKESSKGSNYTSGDLICNDVYTSASCSDTGGSGCDYKTITTTGATKNVTDKTDTSWTVQAKGISYVTWKVYDKAGNSDSCSKITIKKGTKSASSACTCKTRKKCKKGNCSSWSKWKTCNCGSSLPSSTSSRQWRRGKSYQGCNMNNECRDCSSYSYYSDSSCACETYNTCCHQ